MRLVLSLLPRMPWGRELARRARRPSPVQDPDLLAAGQGCAELVRFIYQGGFSELLPGEVPLGLAALGDGVAVDGGPQVGVDPGVGDGIWGRGSAVSSSREGGEDRAMGLRDQ